MNAHVICALNHKHKCLLERCVKGLLPAMQFSSLEKEIFRRLEAEGKLLGV